MHRPGTLFHVLFHVIERLYGISLSHGFWDMNRQHFPNWTGQGEFDYYRYHFEHTVKDADYRIFEFANSWPIAQSREKLADMQHRAQSLSDADLKEAETLFELALPLYLSDRERTKSLLYDVINLNPFHAGALQRLCALEHQAGNKEEAFELIKQAYLVNPYDSSVCYWMGVEHYHRQMLREAVHYLTEAIEYDAGYTYAWQYRGFVNYRLKNYEAALADFETCVESAGQLYPWLTNYFTDQADRGDRNAIDIVKELGL